LTETPYRNYYSNMNSTDKLINEVLDLIDKHGFTTDVIGNVTSLKMDLEDLFYNNQKSNNMEWWENGETYDNHGPF